MRFVTRRYWWSKWKVMAFEDALANSVLTCTNEAEANMRCLRLNRARTQIIFGSLAGLVLVVGVTV